MPGRLRVLSGQDVVQVLGRFGVGQRGSHVKLRRFTSAGQKTLHIPLHRELRLGTLRAIFREASAYATEEKLRPHFFTE